MLSGPKVSGRRGTTAPARTTRRLKKKPGRPEGESNVREAILDAAEVSFAELGYAGTTLRDVAERAHVTQALISYYFGSKHGLFKATFLRRGQSISEQRIDNLKQLQAGGKRVALRQIVEAFLLPTLALRSSTEGRAFLRLQARLHTEPPAVSYDLRSEAYDASTQMYVKAIQEALPSLSAKDAYWRMTLMIGAYMYAFSDTHRLEELAPDICNPESPQEIIEQIVAFVVGGLKARP